MGYRVQVPHLPILVYLQNLGKNIGNALLEVHPVLSRYEGSIASDMGIEGVGDNLHVLLNVATQGSALPADAVTFADRQDALHAREIVDFLGKENILKRVGGSVLVEDQVLRDAVADKLSSDHVRLGCATVGPREVPGGGRFVPSGSHNYSPKSSEKGVGCGLP